MQTPTKRTKQQTAKTENSLLFFESKSTEHFKIVSKKAMLVE
jgi:hypothetical protein